MSEVTQFLILFSTFYKKIQIMIGTMKYVCLNRDYGLIYKKKKQVNVSSFCSWGLEAVLSHILH